jgi:nucleotide-binding universal stress UspA family protein
MFFQSILVPVDFSEDSLYALEHGIMLAKQFDSKLIILHVNHDESMLFHYLTEEEYDKIRERLLNDAKAQLESLVDKFSELAKVDYHYKVRRGVPYVEIVEETEQENIDIVIVGSHGKTSAKKFFYGGTTSKVARRAKCSVMITRKPN